MMFKTSLTTSVLVALLCGTAAAQTAAGVDADPVPAPSDAGPGEVAAPAVPEGESDAEALAESVVESGIEAGQTVEEGASDLATEAGEVLGDVGDALSDELDETDAGSDAAMESRTPTADASTPREGWGELQDGWTRIGLANMSVDDLLGSDITSLDGETIATVGDVLLDDSGSVEYIAAEFGGFLGVGQQSVLLGADDVDVLSPGNEAKPVVRTNITADALKDMPEYDPSL